MIIDFFFLISAFYTTEDMRFVLICPLPVVVSQMFGVNLFANVEIT